MKKFIVFIVGIFVLFINFSSAEEINEIKIENINFSYTDYSLSWEIKNYGNEKSFNVYVFFDDEKIYSSDNKLKKGEVLNDIVYLSDNEKIKNTIGDCKEHIISVKISYEGKTTERKMTIRDSRYIDYDIKISPDPINGPYNYLKFTNETPKFGYYDNIKISAYDNENLLIRNIEADVFLRESQQKGYKKVKTGLAMSEDGAIEIQPYKYGLGNYKVILRQKTLHSQEKFYCNKEINFAVKGKIVIINLPYSAQIGKDVMLTLLTEGTITDEGRKGGKFYIRIKNLDKGKEDILTIGSGLSTIVLNSTYFPNPGKYKITAYKDENYWDDTKEILIIDKPKLEISVPEEVEIGKRTDIEIKSEDEEIKNLEVEIINPDGSITSYKKQKFSLVPTMSGDYEIIARGENYASSSKKFKVLDDMFLEIIKSETDKNNGIKVGDVVKFRAYNKNNETLYPKIFVNEKEIKTHTYLIKDIKTRVIAKLDGYFPVEKEILSSGIIKIGVNNYNFEYGEKAKISIIGEPDIDDCDIKILNKDTNESIYYKGNSYEFTPMAGSYEIVASKENYIPAKINFYVKKAKFEVNVSYEINDLVIKITHKQTPVENAKIYIQTPEGKNLTFITNSDGIVKFKAEGGIYKIYKIEKQNFENIEKEIIVEVPNSNIFAIISLVGIIILILFLIYNRVLYSRKGKEGEIKEKEVNEIYYGEYGEGGLIGMNK